MSRRTIMQQHQDKLQKVERSQDNIKDGRILDVYDYYESIIGEIPRESLEGLHDFPLDSHCGVVCRNIIDKGAELLAMCDPHPHVHDNICKGIRAAISIICFG